MLIAGSFNIKVVAKRLGHANTRTALEVNCHFFAENEEKAIQAIDMALFHKAEWATKTNNLTFNGLESVDY